MGFDPDFLAQFQPRSMFRITDYLGSSAMDDLHEPSVVVVDVRDLNDGTNPPKSRLTKDTNSAWGSEAW